MYQSLKFKLQGESPLLLHNGQLADPLNEYAQAMKKISGKRKKTDADHKEMARQEWYGGLYLDADHDICIPGFVMEATIQEAAKKTKQGKQAKAAILCPGDYKLDYLGRNGSNLEKMWKSGDFHLRAGVKVQRARIMRTRPQFHDWSVEVEVQFDDSILNREEVIQMMETAGDYVGLCDWRPKFGRFDVEVLE